VLSASITVMIVLACNCLSRMCVSTCDRVLAVVHVLHAMFVHSVKVYVR